jgi:hypothetical protein
VTNLEVNRSSGSTTIVLFDKFCGCRLDWLSDMDLWEVRRTSRRGDADHYAILDEWSRRGDLRRRRGQILRQQRQYGESQRSQ